MPRKVAYVLSAALALLSQPSFADHPAAGFGQTISGPVVTIPAVTLPAGRLAVSVRLEWVRFDAFSDQELEDLAIAGEEVHSLDQLLAPSLSLAYGVTDFLTVGARLPHVSRHGIREGHLDAGAAEIHEHGNAKGVGDLTILAQYRLTRSAGSHDVALLGGVKTPTGKADLATEDGEPFEVEHQPGTGSWDPLLGAAWTMAHRSLAVDANVLMALATKGEQETNLGTLITANLAVSRNLLKVEEHAHADGAEEHQHPRLDLAAELNGEWRARQEIAGVEDEGSGGALLYLAPGLRFVTGGRLSMSASVGVPVVQELHGTQHETSLRTIIGLGILF
jgi:hypothetical protein